MQAAATEQSAVRPPGAHTASIRTIDNRYRHGTRVLYADCAPHSVGWLLTNAREGFGPSSALQDLGEDALEDVVQVIVRPGSPGEPADLAGIWADYAELLCRSGEFTEIHFTTANFWTDDGRSLGRWAGAPLLPAPDRRHPSMRPGGRFSADRRRQASLPAAAVIRGRTGFGVSPDAHHCPRRLGRLAFFRQPGGLGLSLLWRGPRHVARIDPGPDCRVRVPCPAPAARPGIA